MKNTQVQIEGIKNQTIGVEVEMNNITRAKAAQIAAEFFRNAPPRKHRRPQRILHLLRLGQRGARMEISERRKHSRT